MNKRRPTYEELEAELAESKAETERLKGVVEGKIKAAIAGKGKPKDTALKILFHDNEVFADAFNHAVFKEPRINPANLVDLDTDESAIISVDGSGITLQFFRDVVKGLAAAANSSVIGAKTICAGGEPRSLLAILGEENQMRIDYKMPLRVMQTQFLSYSRQASIIEQRNRASNLRTAGADQSGEFLSHFRKTDRIVRVICLVVYYGERPWDGPLSLEEMYYDSGLPSLGEANPLHLLDVRHMAEEELNQYADVLRPFFGYLKYDALGNAERYVEENARLFYHLPAQAADALIEITGSENLKWVRQEHTTGGGVNFVDSWEIMKERVRKETSADTFNTVAERLIRIGTDGSTIATATGYDRNHIDSIARRLNRTVRWDEARARC